LISGTGDFPATLLFQQVSGKFIAKQMPLITGKDVRRPESLGTLLFDADNDGDPISTWQAAATSFPLKRRITRTGISAMMAKEILRLKILRFREISPVKVALKPLTMTTTGPGPVHWRQAATR
jgi:hypothetical protein